MTRRAVHDGPQGLRAAALAALVSLLLLASFWPLTSGWRSGLVAGKWEAAWLELRHPLFSISTSAERTRLETALDPSHAAGQELHLVLTRDADTTLWVDGVPRAKLANPPRAPLLWSAHERLCLGGAPGEAGPPLVLRRVALYDRALALTEIRARGGRPAGGPSPVVQLDFSAPPAASAGRPGEPELRLPADATRTADGLVLAGTPACSVRALRELNERVRESQALTLEVVLRLRDAAGEARPVVSLAGEAGSRNLQLDVAADRVSARIRAAYPARHRVADFLLNVVAYVPLGWLVARGRSAVRDLCLAGAVGLGLSLGVEVLQGFRVDRMPSFIDLGTNMAGALVGAWSRSQGSDPAAGSDPSPQ